MTKSLNTVRTGMAAYMGILAQLEAEHAAREIADTLNPPVAATLIWNGTNAHVYQTHYFGDVRVTHKARRHVRLEVLTR